ncbi:MAG: hypothetical protein ACJAYK_001385 [Crocinitomicaceae bacterium]|jgi:hypothetical protein
MGLDNLNLKSNPDISNSDSSVELKVIDSYLELHSGPGRGYPIFHVIEQGQSVKVHTRRTNWFFVSDRRERQGWVKQEALARTLAPTGLPAALPDVQHGDFLAQQARIGFAIGKQEQADTVTVMAGFRLLSWAGIEIEYGEIFDSTLAGTSYGGSFIVEPFQLVDFVAKWPITPFISKGIGKQSLERKTKAEIGSINTSKDDYEFTGVGINYYIGFNFVVRGEYRKMILNGESNNLNNDTWRLGFSSFF